jgi:hypothetical protein
MSSFNASWIVNTFQVTVCEKSPGNKFSFPASLVSHQAWFLVAEYRHSIVYFRG